jgi:hypothetical protein
MKNGLHNPIGWWAIAGINCLPVYLCLANAANADGDVDVTAAHNAWWQPQVLLHPAMFAFLLSGRVVAFSAELFFIARHLRTLAGRGIDDGAAASSSSSSSSIKAKSKKKKGGRSKKDLSKKRRSSKRS